MALSRLTTSDGSPITTSDGSPVYVSDGVAPANTTPATAIDITTLPYVSELDVTGAPESLTNVPTCVVHAWNAVWYRYTAPDTGQVLLYLRAGKAASSNASYLPVASVWTGTADALTELTGEGQDYCYALSDGIYFRVPVTAGDTYWLQVVHDGDTTAPSAAVLEVKASQPAILDAPVGSIVISDDADGYPAALLDPATGAFLRFAAFPAGEFTDTQPDGSICTQDGALDTAIAFLDATWQVGTQIDYAPDRVNAVKSDQAGAFFVVVRANGTGVIRVIKYTSTGTEVWSKTLPSDFVGTSVYAVSRDGARIYASKTSANQPIWVYNFNTNTQEANLAVGVAGQTFAGVGTGYAAQDGSLLFMKNTSTDCFVVRYNQTTGAVLQTYNPTTITFGNRFSMGSDAVGAETMMVWGYIRGDTNDNAYFEALAVSDGSSVTECGPISVTGESLFSTEPDAPDCISNSCPVFVLSASLLVASPVRLTQLPLEIAYDFSILKPYVTGDGLLWNTPPPGD